jgi:hypothetical protein
MEGARKNSVQAARKPNSVLGDHSSRPAVADGLQQPTRRFRCGTHPLGASGRCAPAARMEAAGLPAYLVLLRVGFTLRPALLPARCALTAPFHPYLASFRDARRFAFCCTGRTLALTRGPRTLSGTLPFGVRTFLPRMSILADTTRQRSPGRLHSFESTAANRRLVS